jgi:uncharacterized protein YjiS (DUF1127 family)
MLLHNAWYIAAWADAGGGNQPLARRICNWISALSVHHPASVVSKSRTDFGVEASSRSTHFYRAVNAKVKCYTIPLQTTFSPAQAATRPPRHNTALRRVLSLLRRWWERACPRRQLRELDDHILKDIGLTRYALHRETTRPF